MSYTKNTWKSGDTVTSAKLNNIEDGIAAASGGGVYIVNVNEEDGRQVLDKTAAEILAAAQTSCVIAKEVDGEDVSLMPLFKATHNNIGYGFIFAEHEYYANTVDEYPSTVDEK